MDKDTMPVGSGRVMDEEGNVKNFAGSINSNGSLNATIKDVNVPVSTYEMLASGTVNSGSSATSQAFPCGDLNTKAIEVYAAGNSGATLSINLQVSFDNVNFGDYSTTSWVVPSTTGRQSKVISFSEVPCIAARIVITVSGANQTALGTNGAGRVGL